MRPKDPKRAFLKERKADLRLEANVGLRKTAAAGSLTTSRAGYWCDVCSCLLKDSASYLDHINGKKHSRVLGMSMRVQKSSVSKVKERLASYKGKSDRIKSLVRGEAVSKAPENRRLQKMLEEEQDDDDDAEDEEHDEPAAEDYPPAAAA